MAQDYKQYFFKDGTKAPGATTIVKLLNQPYLIKWANNIGKQGVDVTEYVQATAKQGILIHRMLESHVSKTAIELDEYSDEEIKLGEAILQKYLDWEKEHEIIPICSETAFISEKYRFCGVVDFYCKLDDKYTIVDFKTSKSITKEHFLQLSSYVELLKENNSPVDQILIIKTGKDLDMEFETQFMTLDTCNIYFDMFKSLINVYYIKKKLGWK